MSTKLAEANATDSGVRIVPAKRESKKPLFLPPNSSRLVFAKNAVLPSHGPKRINFGMMRDRSLRMLKAIPLQIERKTEQYVAHWKEIEEFGYGENASEALDDFGRTIEELYLSLHARQGSLGNDLQRVWLVLSKHIEMRPSRT